MNLSKLENKICFVLFKRFRYQIEWI